MNFFGNQNPSQAAIVYVLFVWALIWKGIALWRASKLEQRNWFIALLVLNTIGILEIIYLFRFAKKKLTVEEIKSWKTLFQRNSRPNHK